MTFPHRSSALPVLAFFLTTAFAQFGQQASEYQFGGYTFKLATNGQTGQVVQGMRLVATIYTANGEQKILPMVPEPDATKIKQAFEEWKTSGRKGSTELPRTPVTFEPDGSAIVPLQDGTVVSFKPTYIEYNQPNAATVIPGQAPITTVKFLLEGPAFGKILFGSHTGIFINGNEMKDNVGYGNWGKNSARMMANYFKPMLEGPIAKAADFAAKDPNKPANAPDYSAEVRAVAKRVQ